MQIQSLKEVKRTDNWRICIYGKPGVGKTTAIKYLNGKTLVLALDNSTKVLAGNDIDVIEFDRRDPSQQASEFVNFLTDNQIKYDNLVLDNISSFEKDWFIEQGRKSKSGIRNELQDYSGWTNYFIRFITAIYAYKLNILVTAWEKQVSIVTETGQQFNQYAPEVRDSVRNTFMGLTDIVGRMVVKPQTSERGVILEGNDGIFAKNRLDNRKGCKIEDLFKFGGDENVSTVSVSAKTSQSSKAEISSGK
nr:AAA family ATPase [Lactobacillus amylolyticus]